MEKLIKFKINDKYKCIDGLTLKIIAIISMFIDHAGRLLFSDEIIMLIIGRLAFIIFAFLAVEGFEKTSNLRKYELRMLIFGLISEIPFDLGFFGKPIRWQHQNVFFELFLGLVTLELMYKGKEKNTLTKVVIMFASCYIATKCRLDYSAFGILLMVLFYVHKNEIVPQTIGGLGLSFLSSSIEKYGILALIPISLYNGKQTNSGKKLSKPIRLGFYLFYPIHIIVLYFIKQYFIR